MAQNLVLASQSPRRSELLKTLGMNFSVAPSHCDESIPPGLSPEEGALAVAKRKALAASDEAGEESFVLAADTIVVAEGEILGKPADRADAERMLWLLSGRAHEVITAVALAHKTEIRAIALSTEVTFRELDNAIVKWYLDSGEPFDKAGGYGIQGKGSALVRSIKGSYTNVVGLPVAQTVELLSQFGLSPWGAKEKR